MEDELLAYASHLTLYFALEAPALPGPGSVTDATDPQLRGWRELVVDPVVTAILGPDDGVAERLADHLQDWIAESRFGWGQLRVPDYRLG